MSFYITYSRDSLREIDRSNLPAVQGVHRPREAVLPQTEYRLPGSSQQWRDYQAKACPGGHRTIRDRYPGRSIIIGEGTAAGTVPEENFRVSGFRDLASRMGVPLLNLDEVDRVEVPWKFGELSLPKVALESNYINLPILKLSSAAIFSGAMKNQKGLLTPAMKKKFHRLGLHGPIAELTRTVQPTLTIMDGYNFFRKSMLLAGCNVCDIDQASVSLLNIQEPEYLRLACESGLGSRQNVRIGYGRIKPLGKHKVHPAYKKFLRIRLWSNPRACSMCRLSFHRMRRFSMSDLGMVSQMYAKLAKYAVVGADFVFGSDPTYDPNAHRIVCIGDCTARLAGERGYVHIPGCPPPNDEILKRI